MHYSLSHQNPIPKWLVLAPIGALITLLMFVFMTKLIAYSFIEPVDVVPPKFPSIIFENKPLTPLRPKPIEKPTDVEPPPEVPPQAQVDNKYTGPGITFKKYVPPKNTDPSIFGDAFLPVPQVRVAARYPITALNRGIEGFVDVKFDITSIGSTENIEVLYAEPEGIFENAAINAVKRWKYQPTTSNGKATRFNGLTQRIRFELQK